MEKREHSDRTFPIFVVLSAIFLLVFMFVTFPRLDVATPASSGTMLSPPAKK